MVEGAAEEEEAEVEEGRMVDEFAAGDGEAEEAVSFHMLDVEDGATEVDEFVADAEADMLDAEAEMVVLALALALALSEGNALEAGVEDAEVLAMLDDGAEASVRESEYEDEEELASEAEADSVEVAEAVSEAESEAVVEALADSVCEAEADEASDAEADAEGDGPALKSEMGWEAEAVPLAMSDEAVSLTHCEVDEVEAAILLCQSETEAEDDQESLEKDEADSVGSAEPDSEPEAETDPEAEGETEEESQSVVDDASDDSPVGSKGACPVGVGGTQIVWVVVMSTTTVVVAVIGRPLSSRATSICRACW